ncbi:glycosyltransferase [Rhodococcus sp. JG-3]|uniref:glycosyltransferase n=1 Tax=Rhodococcus sp. JG-3 TaxID=1305835 RepID=UPI0004819FB3|nr:glycosyltransferase [Rhodococcus sp. JG-3]
MKILHVVTLVSPGGEYGGPSRVSLSQASALQAMGHDVDLLATYRGWQSPPNEIDGVRVVLFSSRRALRSRRFAAIFSIAAIVWLMRRYRDYDVVHLHFARDIFSLSVGTLLSAMHARFVVQCHGMVVKKDSRLARAIDRIFTNRVLRTASAILCLNEAECDSVSAVIQSELATISILSNGVNVRRDLVAPTTAGVRLEVLFVARLHPRKRPLTFVDMAVMLLDEGLNANFILVGPDEGEAGSVEKKILATKYSSSIKWVGPISPDMIQARIATADIYVLPAINEPFGMTLIEAMSVGVPVVATASGGLAASIRQYKSGLVAEDSVASLGAAVRQLCNDPALRQRCGEGGLRAVEEAYSVEDVCRKLTAIYRSL